MNEPNERRSKKGAVRRAIVLTIVMAGGLTFGPVPSAEAALAVIDIAAIRQLVSQIEYWKRQLAAMNNELNQLKATHDALTGPRGMQALLPLAERERNYLPRDWAAVAEVWQGRSVDYGALAAAVDATVAAHAVLDDADLAALGVGARARVLEERRAAAGLRVLTQESYAQAGARFAKLAQLVQAIGGAADAKAIEDLQGRIAAEQAMLANEQAKVLAFAQAADAEAQLRTVRAREQALAGHGQFATRFRPELP
jgi:type IV secretion system protein VirB5